MANLDEILSKLGQLIQWRNEVVSNSKETKDLDELVEPTGDEQFPLYSYENEKLQRMSVSNLFTKYSKQNNKITPYYIFNSDLSLAGQGVVNSIKQKVLLAINTRPTFEVAEDEIAVFIFLPSFDKGAPLTATNNILKTEKINFFLKTGKGTYGIGGTPLTETSLLDGFLTREKKEVKNIGDIRTNTISEYINGTGPYSEKFFSAIIDGEDKLYLFKGEEDSIGNGAYQTTEDDFQDLTAEPPADPEDLSDFLDGSILFDKATYKQSASKPTIDMTSVDAFGLVKLQDTDKIYFAKKEDFPATIKGSRIKLQASDKYIDISNQPDFNKSGYDFWDVNGIEVGAVLVEDEKYNFEFWLMEGGNANKEKEITTGGQKNNLPTDKTSIILTGQNAPTILTGFGEGKEGKDVLVYNRSGFQTTIKNDSENSDLENRILCQKGYDTKINIDDVAHFRYYKAFQKWVLISWGNDYIPTLVGDGVRAVTVDGNGILNFEEIVELETKREGQLDEMTNTELETAYPDAIEGFSVKCPFITTGGLMYSKINDQGEWAKSPFTPL